LSGRKGEKEKFYEIEKKAKKRKRTEKGRKIFRN
jgi:hypothetical protein